MSKKANTDKKTKQFIVHLYSSGREYKFLYSSVDSTGKEWTKDEAANWLLNNWVKDGHEKSGAVQLPRETIDGKVVILPFDSFRLGIWEVYDYVEEEEGTPKDN